MIHVFISSDLLRGDEKNIMLMNAWIDVAREKYILRNVATLYDVLADAVDEINSVFSKQVEVPVSSFLIHFVQVIDFISDARSLFAGSDPTNLHNLFHNSCDVA